MDGYLTYLPPAVSDQCMMILVLILAFIGMIVYTRRDRNLPPGPIFIPLKLLQGKVLESLEDLQHKYGPIYSMRLGRMLTVVLNDASAVREALIDQTDVFADRFQPPVLSLLAGGFNGSLLFSNGPEWKELRKVCSSAMRSFGVGKRSLANRINEETIPLLDAITDTKGESFNPTHVVSNAVSNIICSISFGHRFEYSDQKFQELLSMLRLLIQKNAQGMFRYAFTYIVVYLPRYREQMERFRFIKKFVEGEVEEHRATLDPNYVRDIIDVFLLEAHRGKDVDDIQMGIDSVWRTILDLFGAGSDTTTSFLLRAIAIFCHHPSVQDKMFKEITELIGLERLPSYDDRLKLPYTEAVLSEIHRFRPVVPLTPYRTPGDSVVGGYHIPKGSRVLINYWAVHHNPDDWEEPELFQPERFLNANGGTTYPDSHFPFGLGRRICLGESLAKMELFLFLTSLVQRFRFFTPDGSSPPSLDGVRGITFTPKPYDVRAEARI